METDHELRVHCVRMAIECIPIFEDDQPKDVVELAKRIERYILGGSDD